MADNTATYGVKFDDGITGAASVAAGALDKLRESMARDTQALTALKKAMSNLKQGGSETTAQVGKLNASMEAVKARIAKAQAAYLDLGGSLVRTGQKTQSFRERMMGLQSQAQQMPGPVGQLIGLFDRFASVVGGGMMAAGIIAITAAVIAFTVAMVNAGKSLFDYVTETQNARRAEGLRLEGLTRQWSAVAATYGLAKMAGKDLQAGIDRVSASTSLSREQTAKYGAQLYTMGLRGKQWESALEGMTMKSAVQGEAQAQMFASWAAGTALMGGSVDRLTARVKGKLGGIAKAQMLDANVQALKLKENFDSMFRTIDIEPLLKAKASLFAMFSQSTASGRYLADLLGRVVQPLIDGATKALPIVKRFFQSLIIAALQVEIAYLRVRNKFAEVFDAGVWRKRFDAWKEPLTAIKDLVLSIAVVMVARLLPAALEALIPITMNAWAAAGGLLAMSKNAGAALRTIATQAWPAVRALGALAWEAVVIAFPFVLAVATVFILIRTFKLLKQAWDELDFGLFWKQVKRDWDSFDWGSFGLSIIDGIAGAFAHPGRLIDAVKGLAGQVIDAFTGTLKIQSPSKVFANLGAEIPAGVVVGIEGGKRDVQAATADMALPQPAPMKSAASVAAEGGGAKGARGGAQVTIQGGIHITGGGGNAKQMALDIKRELESILEGVALQMGAA